MPEGLQNGHEIKVEDAKPSEVVAGVPDFIQVTARTFPAMMENCCYWDDKRHFVNVEEVVQQIISSLPLRAKIVDVGSGVYQELARFFKEKRPDVTVFSLDPTLSVNPQRIDSGELIVFRDIDEECKNKVSERVTYATRPFLAEGIDHFRSDDNNFFALIADPRKSLLRTFGEQLPPGEALAIHNKRLESAQEFGGIPFVYPFFPKGLVDIDWILEFCGPLYYADVKDPRKYTYLRALIESLKNGGKVDIDPWQRLSFNMDEYYYIDGSHEFEKKFYKKLGKVDAQIEIEYPNSSVCSVRPRIHLVRTA